MPLDTCVIFNPMAGRGRAAKLLNRYRSNLINEMEFLPTSRAGEAREIALAAAERGFRRIVAAGGDGTVHEVANGILASSRRDVVFSTWPLGSANDYAYTLGLTEWWKKREERPPTEVMAVDVGRITGGGRDRYYVNSLGIGFNGMVVVESRQIHSLSGLPLYTLAFLKAMVRHFATPTMKIRFDDRQIDGPTLALTINLAQREGGFPLTPDAKLTDGRFDIMHAGKLRRIDLLRYLPAMALGKLPRDHPIIHLLQAERIEVTSAAPMCIHADGEFFCVAKDEIKEVFIEMLPKRLLVEIYPPYLYGGRQ